MFSFDCEHNWLHNCGNFVIPCSVQRHMDRSTIQTAIGACEEFQTFLFLLTKEEQSATYKNRAQLVEWAINCQCINWDAIKLALKTITDYDTGKGWKTRLVRIMPLVGPRQNFMCPSKASTNLSFNSGRPSITAPPNVKRIIDQSHDLTEEETIKRIVNLFHQGKRPRDEQIRRWMAESQLEKLKTGVVDRLNAARIAGGTANTTELCEHLLREIGIQSIPEDRVRGWMATLFRDSHPFLLCDVFFLTSKLCGLNPETFVL